MLEHEILTFNSSFVSYNTNEWMNDFVSICKRLLRGYDCQRAQIKGLMWQRWGIDDNTEPRMARKKIHENLIFLSHQYIQNENFCIENHSCTNMWINSDVFHFHCIFPSYRSSHFLLSNNVNHWSVIESIERERKECHEGKNMVCSTETFFTQKISQFKCMRAAGNATNQLVHMIERNYNATKSTPNCQNSYKKVSWSTFFLCWIFVRAKSEKRETETESTREEKKRRHTVDAFISKGT